MTIRRSDVDVGSGQVHCAPAGDGGPWIAFFHESPLSGQVWHAVIENLANRA